MSFFFFSLFPQSLRRWCARACVWYGSGVDPSPWLLRVYVHRQVFPVPQQLDTRYSTNIFLCSFGRPSFNPEIGAAAKNTLRYQQAILSSRADTRDAHSFDSCASSSFARMLFSFFLCGKCGKKRLSSSDNVLYYYYIFFFSLRKKTIPNAHHRPAAATHIQGRTCSEIQNKTKNKQPNMYTSYYALLFFVRQFSGPYESKTKQTTQK